MIVAIRIVVVLPPAWSSLAYPVLLYSSGLRGSQGKVSGEPKDRDAQTAGCN